VEEAIVYSSANVKGGWMQYKAYLDKTLKNKWAAGYLETISTTSSCRISYKICRGDAWGKVPQWHCYRICKDG